MTHILVQFCGSEIHKLLLHCVQMCFETYYLQVSRHVGFLGDGVVLDTEK